MHITVGSNALAIFNLNRLPPNDLDIWTDDPLFKAEGDISIIPKSILDLIPTYTGYATPDAIYTIKCSHLGWDNPMWSKYKLDIIWLEANGCKLIQKLYNALVEYWKVELKDKPFLSLNRSKEEFFTDNVSYQVDHDYLHELVAHPNQPVYTTILKEGHQVMLDKSKFDQLRYHQQVRLFREEITVIACERWLLNPYWKGKVSWYKAYKLSLKKTITNLTKGWATSFIVTNLKYFIKPEYSYFENALNTLMKEEVDMLGVDMSVFEEVKEYLGFEGSLEELVYDMCENNLIEYDQFDYQHLQQEGGGEGGGEHCFGVFKLKGKIYRAEYSYYSYNGHEYDCILETLREVKPVEKTITVYE